MLGFFYKIFLSRNLTTAELGIYSISISVFMVFITIISSGISISITKYTPTFSKDKQNKLVYSGLICTVVLAIICIAFILIFNNFFNFIFSDNKCYLILLTMLPALLFTGIYSPVKGNLLGNEQYLQSSIVEFIEQIIKMISCIVLIFLIKKESSFLVPGISISIGSALSTLIGYYIYIKNKGKITKSNLYFKPLIKSGAPITAVRFLSSIIQPIISIILPIQLVRYGLTNELALSELGIIMGMTMPILSIPFTFIGSLSMALIPKVSLMNSKHNDQLLRKQISLSIFISIVSTFLVFPVFGGLGEPICNLLFSNNLAGKYLTYSAWLIIPMSLSQLTSTILNALGYENKSFIYYIIGNMLLMFSIIFLPKYLGSLSMIYGLGICNSVISLLNIIKLNKITKSNNFYLKEIIKLIIITLPCTILTKFLFNILNSFIPLFISLILACLISIAISTVMLICFKFINIKHIKDYLTKNRKHA